MTSFAWEALIVTEGVVIILLSAVVIGLLRHVTPILEQSRHHHDQPTMDVLAQGPAVGARLPRFVARDRDHKIVDESSLHNRSAVLLFLSPGCGPCKELAAELTSRGLAGLASELVVIVNSQGDMGLGGAVGLSVLAEPQGEVSAAFGISGRPFAVAVDQSGFIRGSRFVNKISELHDLMLLAGDDPQRPAHHPNGQGVISGHATSQ